LEFEENDARVERKTFVVYFSTVFFLFSTKKIFYWQLEKWIFNEILFA